MGGSVVLDADKVFYRLSDVYFFGVIFILGWGLIYTTWVTYLFFSNYKKLNSVLKSYMSVIIPDIFMVVNFWFRDLYNIHLGYLDEGPWCAFSAFIAIMAITALNCGAVCVAYTTYKLVKGEQMPDIYVIYWNITSWIFATVLAGIFLAGGLLGPYKGLYCCVKETQYRAYAVAPIILVTITAIITMIYFYYSAWQIIALAESKRTGAAGGGAKASETVMKRGVLLVSVFYGCWSIIIFAGFTTSVGFKLPAAVDLFGAWLAKLMPIVDSVLLLQMLNRVLGKGQKVGPSHNSETGDVEEGKRKGPEPPKATPTPTTAGAGGAPGGAGAPPAKPSAPPARPEPAKASAPTPVSPAVSAPVPVGSKAVIAGSETPAATGSEPAPAVGQNPFIPPPLSA